MLTRNPRTLVAAAHPRLATGTHSVGDHEDAVPPFAVETPVEAGEHLDRSAAPESAALRAPAIDAQAQASNGGRVSVGDHGDVVPPLAVQTPAEAGEHPDRRAAPDSAALRAPAIDAQAQASNGGRVLGQGATQN